MKKKIRIKPEVIIAVLLLFTISFLTVGYARYTRLLTINSTSTFKADGIAWISSLTVYDSSNVDTESHTINGLDVDFNVAFANVGSNADYHITYQVTIQNDSYFSYDFTQSVVDADVTAAGGNININYQVTGIDPGETIPSRSSKTFYVTVTVTIAEGYEGDINIDGEITNEVEHEDIGSIIGVISGTDSGDLVNNSQAPFTISVANTFPYIRHFNFSLNSTDFDIVDCSTGNPISEITIPENTTNSYQICIKANPDVEFSGSPQSVGVFMNCTETGRSTVGFVNLDVPVTIVVTDHDAPVISSVSVTRVYGQTGNATITWSGTDESNITAYYIVVKKAGADPTTIGPLAADTNPESYTFTGMSENTNYEFIIYGVDQHTNSGAGSVSDPSSTSGYAVTTGTVNYSWHYAVTWHLSGMTVSSGATTAEEDKTYSATLRLNNSLTRDWPNNLTITMGGHNGSLSKCSSDNSSCDGYYWNNGTLKIYHVTGALDITGSDQSACLTKGTKVLLANGKYKNIEDIGYDDLLAVWDYKNGKITYEYPIWIEKEEKTKLYQKTTFSDGKVLNTVGDHAVFDLDNNLFVNVHNPDEFGIGSRVAKIENGKIKPITVKNIEYIKKKTTYYHVVSTTYYNIIANDILTTDDATILSNLYGFTDNIKWPNSRNEIINDKSNLYDYEDINNSLPYYMFRGLRASEAKYIINLGYMTDEELQYYFLTNQSNPDMVKQPITKNNSRYWPVSIDNKKFGLIKEGEKFTLPKSKVSCYYNTSDNKCYKPNEKITIYYGTHFIAK